MFQMLDKRDFTLTNFLLWNSVLLGVSLLVLYFWRNRQLYYYASKIPGPFSVPFLGTLEILLRKDLFKTFNDIITAYPSVSKMWIGPHLYIATRRPQDMEAILPKFLEKGNCYEYFVDQVQNSLIPAPVEVWRKHRKILNHSFTPRMISNFHDIFVKYSKKVVKVLDDLCGEEQTDLMRILWETSFGIVAETLVDVESPDPSTGKRLVSQTMRLEQIMIERIARLWLFIEPIWKISALGREAQALTKETFSFVRNMIAVKMDQMENNKSDTNKEDDIKNSLFIPALINADISLEQMVEEFSATATAANETSSSVITCFILVMGMYPELQEKVYQEVTSVLGDKEDITPEDVNRMTFLERVLKETLRLFPPIALIVRYIDQDLDLDPHIFPAGSNILISLIEYHRTAELWPDPLKFDPDRFLPEEVAKRHRYTYIPFSKGARNCIGARYGMIQMRCLLPNIVRNFKMTTTKCKSIEDIKFDYMIAIKPKDYGIILEKRKGIDTVVSGA